MIIFLSGTIFGIIVGRLLELWISTYDNTMNDDDAWKEYNKAWGRDE